MRDDAPVLIWTFRRCGGSNLSRLVFEAAGRPVASDEPFNPNRAYGYVKKRWLREGDDEQLKKDLDAILSKRESFKHCLELMPIKFNLILAQKSLAFGYRHLFLYRESARDRLLSLNYSLLTNVWGRKHLDARPIDPKIFGVPAPVSKRLHQETQARSEMKQVYDVLFESGVEPLQLSFEMLYKSEEIYTRLVLKDLFELLSSEPVDGDLYQTLTSSGKQYTDQDYLRFPDADKLASEADKLGEFKLYETYIPNNDVCSLKILYHESWEVLPSVFSSKCHYQGVVVASVNLAIEVDGRDVSANWLPSQRMEEKFSGAFNSSSARYLTTSQARFSDIDLVSLEHD